jgi:GNAT superfamily N-acetyltransferase
MKDKSNISKTGVENKSLEVEGEWEEFILKIVDSTDEILVEKIIQHLRATYYREEPCHKYLGWNETKAANLDFIIKSILPHNLSLVAISKETQGIAGVRITLDGRHKLNISELPNITSPHLKKIFKLKNVLIQRAPESPHWKEFIGTGNDYVSAFIASVDSKYRGQGLAKEMSARSLNLLRSRGYPIIRSFFSSPITRKISEKLGYTEISRVYFDELIGYDGEGLLDFPRAEPGAFANFMALKL